MPHPSAKSRPYKELTFQQLRSFCETARLGSLAAAAKAIGLTHPTVREQVLSLQREFQVKLIEPHGRGCHLTEEGRLLADMAAPIVTSANALMRRFALAREDAEVRMVVAGPPRVIQEDLPTAVLALLNAHSRVRLAFLEIHDDQVIQAVDSGDADFGLTSGGVPDCLPPGLVIEPGYNLETLLLTPANHPLAGQRIVRPPDLRRYPLISSRYTLSDQPELAGMLERNCVFDGPSPRVEPFLAATVRKYVELGLGIALVYGLPSHRRTTLHERSMTRYFGSGLVRFVVRRGAATAELAQSFADLIRKCNQHPSRKPSR